LATANTLQDAFISRDSTASGESGFRAAPFLAGGAMPSAGPILQLGSDVTMTTIASALAANAAKRRAPPPWEELGFRSLKTEIVEARALEVPATMPKELWGVLTTEAIKIPQAQRSELRSPQC
jgi:hypothetical protein